MTLVLPRKGTLGVNDKQPFVYLKCGHVHGQHQWGQSHDSNDGRTCPLCLTVSWFYPLGPMVFPIDFDAVKSGWSILYIEGSQVIISIFL